MNKFFGTLSFTTRVLASSLAVLIGTVSPAHAQARTYEIDTAHSDVSFGVRHLGISNVNGTFSSFKGTIKYDPKDLKSLAVSVEVDPSSIDTRNTKRDDHVRSADLLNVPKFPKATFVSQKVSNISGNSLDLEGTLSLHGVSKPLTLHVANIVGPGVNPLDKKEHIGASATATIKRQDFGITWNGGGMTGIAGEAAIGDEIKFRIEIDGVAVDTK